MILNLFKKKIQPKTSVPFTEKELCEVIKQNRETLNEIENWIDKDSFSHSFFQYGIPDFLEAKINKKINNDPIYTDYILHIAKKYFKKINYLEIGVSVGKNLYQLLKGIGEGSFTGFDIEEINPVIAQKFKLEASIEWDTMNGSIKKNKSSLRSYSFERKKVNYISADVLDENSWLKLKGNKYNIVFSDALHTAEAILFEFEMLMKYNLLDDRFAIVWDDLVGPMQQSFFSIIKKYDKKFKIKDIYLLQVNGWVGQHEEPHTVGIISNFTL